MTAIGPTPLRVVGGGGGSVPAEVPSPPSGTGGGTSTPPPSQVQNNSCTTADLLCELGVYTLARHKREKVAAQLDTCGVTRAMLLDLWRYVEQSAVSDARLDARRLMASLVADPKKLTAAIEDLDKYRTAQAQHVTKKWAPGEGDRQRTRKLLEQHRHEWAEQDRAHWIRCRMSDGATREISEAEYEQEHKR